MKRAKYEVYRNNEEKNGRLSAIYVTEKRNAEYMIQEIRKKYEKLDKWGNPEHFKVYQTIEGEKKLIYTPKSRKFFDENLVV
jgi:hypothetical protein